MTRAPAARPTPSEGSRVNFAPLWEYFNRSERPLTSLVFILPFLIIYELGTSYFSGGLLAASWLHRFLALFGASGRYLPAFTVVTVLLCWHLARRDSWDINPLHLGGMLLESLLLAVPLILICQVAATYIPMSISDISPGTLTRYLGAGIYEEMVFRLGAFSVLGILFVDLLKLKKPTANALMLVIAALAFSLCHYWGNEPFHPRTFIFRTVAGMYFGIVFAFRGFGISAGAHASYDVIIHLIYALG